MLKMGQVHVIRHKYFAEGTSIRQIAREMKISRNTVRKYLHQSEPNRKEPGPRPRPVLGKAGGRIEEILEEWKPRTTEKQRPTGTRIHRQLVEEGYKIGITTVRDYLAEKKKREMEVFVPLSWRVGDGAQVDFFEVTVEVAGERITAWKFLMRLMYSGRDFVWLYPRCNQIAFLDGHVRAFSHFGGVPARCVYDNLTAAVKRRLGLLRELTDRFLALSSHYLFEPCFARPGEGHDKGGVEARGKGIRLQHLTPIPRGESLEAICSEILADVDRAAEQRADRAGRTVADRFAEEKGALRGLPAGAFEARQAEPVVANRQALVRIEGADYSVPSHWHSRSIMAFIGVADIRFEYGSERFTAPKVARGRRQISYRHYLPELAKKPQALRQVAPELLEELGEPYRQIWELLEVRYGQLQAARVLAKLLGAIGDGNEEVLSRALEQILESASTSPSATALPPMTVKVPDALSGYTVESVDASTYDELLLGAAE
jgi:transposase